jgi:hypothetical protein
MSSILRLVQDSALAAMVGRDSHTRMHGSIGRPMIDAPDPSLAIYGDHDLAHNWACGNQQQGKKKVYHFYFLLRVFLARNDDLAHSLRKLSILFCLI